jgi:hypothetical protein
MSVNAISRRKTVLALVEESTEGVPVKPSAATDFTALQEGFTMSPSFNVLNNAELKASIGKSKPELGAEAPTGQLAHYIKASGVEGQDVDYKVLLKAAFGARSTYGTERATAAASTTVLLKLAAGGSDFPRGRAFLLKDPVNGFQIRNSLGYSTNDITIAQKLLGAPAAGVNTGKCVAYSVADEGHPTFSMWQYLGNAGAIELMSGARVTEMSISAQAGEFINGSFTVGGVKYYFNPIVVTATDTKLDFSDSTPTIYAATIAAGTYKDPHELAAAIETAMNALGSVDIFTVVYQDADGKFKITSDGTVFELLHNTGANAANSIADLIGFSVAADDTGALFYVSDTAQSWAAPYSPDYDDSSANVAKSNEAMLGGQSDIACFKAQSLSVQLSNTKTDIPDLCEDSGKSGSLFTGREVTAQVTYLLSKHDAAKFKAFRAGDKTSLTYNFGVKAGGQWVGGKCVNIFLASATITALDIQDSEGLCVVQCSLTGYVEDGLPELFLNFV